jgi:hypothetical protein
MKGQGWHVEEALRTKGVAVHVGVRRGWSSTVTEGEVLTFGDVSARVVKVMYAPSWDALPDRIQWAHQGDLPDPVTAATYGLYAVRLLRI